MYSGYMRKNAPFFSLETWGATELEWTEVRGFVYGGIGCSTGAQPLQSSRVVYDRTRYDKLLKVTTGPFYEYTCGEQQGPREARGETRVSYVACGSNYRNSHRRLLFRGSRGSAPSRKMRAYTVSKIRVSVYVLYFWGIFLS